VTAPDALLVGAGIVLEPITANAADELDALARDPDARRFTRVPSTPRPGFGTDWAARYTDGWNDGTRAGFVIRDPHGAFFGLVAFVSVDREGRQAEAGYVVAPGARGQGVASEALRVLTIWGFEELGLERIELLIDVENEASAAVARRCGYTHEGTLRSTHLKDGLRTDTMIWARLAAD
jgi:RimJ/RimL family protein N-acetyltransferase